MATMNIPPNSAATYYVVHPLDDDTEQKCSTQGLGRIQMSRSVRLSLRLLRSYLLLMTLMLVYHVLDLAGVLPTLHQ